METTEAVKVLLVAQSADFFHGKLNTLRVCVSEEYADTTYNFRYAVSENEVHPAHGQPVHFRHVVPLMTFFAKLSESLNASDMMLK